MHTRGFTLIELLVVIAIIGILASVVLASLNAAREKARDTQRMADLRQVQNALQMYYADNGSYPSTGGSWRGTVPSGGSPSCYGNYGQNAIPGLAPDYIPVIPEDPQTDTAGHCYLYRSNGADYMFLAHATVETFDPDGPPQHPMDRQAYDQQSIAVYSEGAANW